MSETETTMQKSDWKPLLDELRNWFIRGEVEAPARQVLKMPQPDGSEASLLLMPAWVPGKAIGVKVVTFLPENARAGRPVIHSGYMLFDGETGALISASEAESLTARRTAAVSALGADHLARKDARRLLVVGTGQLAPFMAAAHASVRSYEDIAVWGRNPDRAETVAEKLCRNGLPARPVIELEPACAEADVITTVTASTEPVIRGSWLRPGTHLDLVGAFREDMRESDDEAIAQARLFADDRESAMRSGDLAQPAAAGRFDPSSILADLADLCRGDHSGRGNGEERTVFKSAGTAVADLATASLMASRPS